MANLSVTGLAFAEGTLETQLMLVLIWAFIWYFGIKSSAKYFFEPFVASKPWKDQWIDLNAKTFKTAFFIEFKTSKETFEFACLCVAIICQHAVGGALCLPSMLGGSGAVISALACHGGLCEAGWELQDAIVRIYQILFGGKAGKAQNPTPLVVILGLHHAMGLGMVIPMNIVYRDNCHYHEFIFLLQGAAFVACMSQNYGYTLDIKTLSGLKQMKVCVTVTLLTMVYSRFLRYAFVGYKLISTFYADGRTMMLCGGGLVLGLMGLLNILFVMDAVGKFSKFIHLSYSDEDLQPKIARVHSSFHRHNTPHIMRTSQREWAIVRGAVLLGSFRKPTAEQKKNM